jgi:hypothetical protein
VRPQLKFIVAVARHWGALVTGGVLIGIVSLWQNTGHVVPHYVSWSIAVIGLVIAFYRTWREENQKVANLTDALAQSVKDREAEHQQVASLPAALGEKAKEQAHETLKQRQESKRELVQALTSLRASEQEVRKWLDLTDNKWGMAPPSVKLLPDDWGNVVYVAGMVSDEVRSDLDSLLQKLSEANSLIGRFLGMQVNFRDQRLMPPAHALLSESAPLLSKVIAVVEVYERSLR